MTLFLFYLSCLFLSLWYPFKCSLWCKCDLYVMTHEKFRGTLSLNPSGVSYVTFMLNTFLAFTHPATTLAAPQLVQPAQDSSRFSQLATQCLFNNLDEATTPKPTSINEMPSPLKKHFCVCFAFTSCNTG